MAKEKINKKEEKVPYKEIDSVKNNKFSLLNITHKYIIKPLGNIASNKIKREIFAMVGDGRPKSILDVSCGDNFMISEMSKKYKPDICIGNDISWKTINLVKNKNNNVFFTNHNILNLPYRIIFDLVIFKNTLHHIDIKKQAKTINDLKKISKQLIIVDIDDPQNCSLLSKIWNFYYRHVLGDCGKYFLSFEKFKKIIEAEAVGEKHKLGIVNTIKGRYFFASLGESA